MISNNEHETRLEQSPLEHRVLRVENLENRNLLAVDLDDSLSEARSLGTVTDQPVPVTAEISEATDVDMVRVSLASGQTIDVDVDTPSNGPDGLGGYLRVFNEQGVEIAANNDAMAPDDASAGFDPYLRFTAAQNGSYYIAVSNWENTQFDPIGGAGDVAGQQYAVGGYQLTLRNVPQFDGDDAISEAITLGGAGPTQYSVNGEIDSDVDVDMYRIDLMNNQSVAFDIDTTANGPGGLGSYLTLFDSNGNVVAANNDGAAPGESLGFDAYLQLSVATGGPFYLAVSNFGNTSFNPISGDGDTGGSMYASGTYRLTVGEVAPSSFVGEGASMASATASNSADMSLINSSINGPISTEQSSVASRQAAPMIGQLESDLRVASGVDTSGMARRSLEGDILIGPKLEWNGTTDGSFDSSMNASLNDSLNGSSLGTPPIVSPLSAFGSFDAASITSADMAAMGTTSVDLGPGQLALNQQVDTRSAIATDMALMQSL